MTRLSSPAFGPLGNRPLDTQHVIPCNIWQTSAVQFRMFRNTEWVNGIAIYRQTKPGTVATLEVDPIPVGFKQGTIWGTSHNWFAVHVQNLYGLYVIVGYTWQTAGAPLDPNKWRQARLRLRKHTNDELIAAFDDGATSSGPEPDYNDFEARYRIGVNGGKGLKSNTEDEGHEVSQSEESRLISELAGVAPSPTSQQQQE